LRALEAVHGDVPGVAPKNVGGRLYEPVHGLEFGIVVPADEVVLGVALKPANRGRQVFVEQDGIIEALICHGWPLPLATAG